MRGSAGSRCKVSTSACLDLSRIHVHSNFWSSQYKLTSDGKELLMRSSSAA